MNTLSRFRRWSEILAPKGRWTALAIAIVAFGTACSGSRDVQAEALPATGVPGELTELTENGTEVSLLWVTGEQQIGANPIEVRIPGQTTAPILDLLSPEMPMHGVLRYTAELVAPGLFSATIDVPMEGTWALYVDLDGGKEVAEYAFTVQADTNAEPMHH